MSDVSDFDRLKDDAIAVWHKQYVMRQAAPDMLAALKEFCSAARSIGSNVVDWAGWINDAQTAAEAAIAKAEGRTS